MPTQIGTRGEARVSEPSICDKIAARDKDRSTSCNCFRRSGAAIRPVRGLAHSTAPVGRRPQAEG
eukprot:7767839-Alexandrium_andersonii.AAC.1